MTEKPWKIERHNYYSSMAQFVTPYIGTTLIPFDDAQLMAAAPELLDACELVLLHPNAHKALGTTLTARIQKAIDLALNKKTA